MFLEANGFPRAKLEEKCELQGTDNVQISEQFFLNRDYCLYSPSNILKCVQFLKMENTADILQF